MGVLGVIGDIIGGTAGGLEDREGAWPRSPRAGGVAHFRSHVVALLLCLALGMLGHLHCLWCAHP